ncbi:transcriptional regulator [Bacillus toyonensis]|uniref:transcriptional regulator n=1 Tax=Bacillus toyonensis TaxID=155322 RepID=UPI000BF1CCAA|nr:transcriptional regulator [Bacillus toyonensis]PEO61501.1 transcriptional regulator [Bacillus toyonensis]PFX80397.1 transcriptional regulator [Bacillus toyonensis]PFX83892.1 transcriptional regulator [Bacillus toyonensis]PGB09966.1 transcriptional regulator [Bacillus toyonensis]PHB45593.1 transcriptional regulator [Bacillus toyonensis]
MLASSFANLLALFLSSTMSLILNEKSIPTLPVAIRIAKALNMHVEEIWIDEE